MVTSVRHYWVYTNQILCNINVPGSLEEHRQEVQVKLSVWLTCMPVCWMCLGLSLCQKKTSTELKKGGEKKSIYFEGSISWVWINLRLEIGHAAAESYFAVQSRLVDEVQDDECNTQAAELQQLTYSVTSCAHLWSMFGSTECRCLHYEPNTWEVHLKAIKSKFSRQNQICLQWKSSVKARPLQSVLHRL